MRFAEACLCAVRRPWWIGAPPREGRRTRQYVSIRRARWEEGVSIVMDEGLVTQPAGNAYLSFYRYDDQDNERSVEVFAAYSITDADLVAEDWEEA